MPRVDGSMHSLPGWGRGGRLPGSGSCCANRSDRGVYDEIMRIEDKDAMAFSRRLAREEGLLAGISAGANVFAARKVAEKLGAGKTVVTIICDTGERYLSVNM